MTHTLRSIAPTLTLLTVTGALCFAQAPAQPATPQDDTSKQVQQLLREDHVDEALAAARKAADASPASVQANTQAGVILDLQGRYTDARTYLQKAVTAATKPEEKSRALRNMAMSYAFERDCPGALKYQQQAFDMAVGASDFTGAAEIANEVARVCLESNSVDEAASWYRKGYDTALKSTGLTPAQKDLWEFRWEHAQARVAARRGQKDEAQKHVAAARAALDKGTNPQQAAFMTYLVGYVAFYGGDYKAALAELQKANQDDPFILALMAQSHEKLGQGEEAKALYKKILTYTSHNPTNAYARPLAMQRLK